MNAGLWIIGLAWGSMILLVVIFSVQCIRENRQARERGDRPRPWKSRS